MAIGFRGGDDSFSDSQMYSSTKDDRFGYGLREQADIKEDLKTAKRLLKKASAIMPHSSRMKIALCMKIDNFLNK